MALIKGQMLGDMSGKLGGMVLTRVKGGKMVRARVQPTDAKTEAQKKVRSVFSQAASLWGSLSGAVQRGWNSFAITYFRARHSKKHSRPSGFQAFSSLNNFLGQLSSHNWGADFSVTAIVADFADIPQSVQNVPPGGFNSYIQDTNKVPISLSLANFTYDSVDGSCVATIGMNPGPQTTKPDFSNPGSNIPLGLAFYMSSVIPPGRMNVSNYEQYLLCAIGAIEVTSGWVAASDFALKFTVDADYLLSIKQGVSQGSDVFITAVAFNQFGQSAKIGTKRITIS
jgi:hypothetical protein